MHFHKHVLYLFINGSLLYTVHSALLCSLNIFDGDFSIITYGDSPHYFLKFCTTALLGHVIFHFIVWIAIFNLVRSLFFELFPTFVPF